MFENLWKHGASRMETRFFLNSSAKLLFFFQLSKILQIFYLFCPKTCKRATLQNISNLPPSYPYSSLCVPPMFL